MLQELLDQLCPAFFGEGGEVRLAFGGRDGDDVVLGLEVSRIGPEPHRVEYWEVTCVGATRHHLELAAAWDLAILQEHVLLWEAVDPPRALFFRGKPADPHRLVGALYARHRRVAGRHPGIPFERYLTHAGQYFLARLLASGGGRLADGPERLLREYAGVLAAHGVSPSLVDSPASGAQPGPYFPNMPPCGNLGAAVLVTGNSFVIAGRFTARLVEVGAADEGSEPAPPEWREVIGPGSPSALPA